MPTLALNRPVSGRASTTYGISMSGWAFVFQGWVRREISGGARHAVFIGTAVRFDRPGEIAMGRRRGRLPLDGRGSPRIIRSDLLAFEYAIKEIDNERKLSQTEEPDRVRNELVRVHHTLWECAGHPGVLSQRVGRAAIIHAAIQPGEALREHRLE